MTRFEVPATTDSIDPDELLSKRESPTRRLEDIPGLEEHCRKLRTSVVKPLETDAFRSLRAESVLVIGPDGVGKSDLVAGLIGSLEEATEEHACYHLEPPECGDYEWTIDDLLQGLEPIVAEEQPAVLHVENLEEMNIGSWSTFTDMFDHLVREDPPLTVVGELGIQTERNVLDGYSSAEAIVEIADLVVELPQLGEDRRIELLDRRLESIAGANDAVTLAADIESTTAGSASEGFRLEHLDAVAERSVLLAIGEPEDGAIVDEAHVERAIEHVRAETPELGGREHRRERESGLFSPSVPEVSFDDVGGLDGVIDTVRKLTTYPQKYDDLFRDAGIDPGHGLLLHGPPGTGKTLLAKAIANETDREFLSVKGPELKTKWFGESEERIRMLFETAMENAPSVVFFDEFDAIAGSRDGDIHSATRSMVNTLLTEMDGLEERGEVLFIAATNRPDALDEAVLRPGRIGEQIEVGLPDAEGRKEIFEIHTADLPLADDVSPADFVDRAPADLTGAHIAAIVEQAVYLAIDRVEEGNRSTACIRLEDLDRAIDAVWDESDTDAPRVAFA